MELSPHSAARVEIREGLLYVSCDRIQSLEDCMELTREVEVVERHPDCPLLHLIDVRPVRGAPVGFNGILSIVRRQREKRQGHPERRRVALVVAGPLQFGLARMYQSLTTKPESEVEIFSEIKAAEGWLREILTMEAQSSDVATAA